VRTALEESHGRGLRDLDDGEETANPIAGWLLWDQWSRKKLAQLVSCVAPPLSELQCVILNQAGSARTQSRPFGSEPQKTREARRGADRLFPLGQSPAWLAASRLAASAF
jgi:hypothetical protein